MRAFDGEVAFTDALFYLFRMLQRTFPAGFIAPCLPTKTDRLPSGKLWLHEINARECGSTAVLAMISPVASSLGSKASYRSALARPTRSGRSRHWFKSKNPKHPAVKREAEEDWKGR